MEPVTATALALAAGGAAANYLGARSEARRKSRAIKKYRGRMDGINARLLEVLANQGRLEQEGMIDGITRGGAEASATGQRFVADRRGEVNARLAALAGATPGLPAPGSAPLTSVGRRAALAQAARDAGMVVDEQGRARDEATVAGALPGRANLVATRTGQTRAQLDSQAAEADLQRVMGSTGNTAMNLQLLGALAGTGSQVAFMGAERAPIKTT